MKNHHCNIWDVPPIEERYGFSFIFSFFLHCIAVLAFIYGGFILPSKIIVMGGGAGGGGNPGDLPSVGVVDDLSGGTGMIKPSITPKPPALPDPPSTDYSKAIPLLNTVERKRPAPNDPKSMPNSILKSNVIPVAPEPGSGGIAGGYRGTGGGLGSGSGISIGSGWGGFGDSWYARAVESRISANWLRPPEGTRVEIIYSFYIASDGTVHDIKQEKSSGNPQIDLTAERAIRALQVDPLPPPPPEFRGKKIQFLAHFVHPPSQ